MPATIEFPYSKNSALLGVGVPVIFLLITFSNLKSAYLARATVSYGVIVFADLVFLTQMAYIFITRLIPSLKNEIALELNDKGIEDFIRKVEIEWADIKAVNWEAGRNSSKLVIDLKHETDYGTQIAISLRWLKGKDREICETVIARFEEIKLLH